MDTHLHLNMCIFQSCSGGKNKVPHHRHWTNLQRQCGRLGRSWGLKAPCGDWPWAHALLVYCIRTLPFQNDPMTSREALKTEWNAVRERGDKIEREMERKEWGGGHEREGREGGGERDRKSGKDTQSHSFSHSWNLAGSYWHRCETQDFHLLLPFTCLLPIKTMVFLAVGIFYQSRKNLNKHPKENGEKQRWKISIAINFKVNFLSKKIPEHREEMALKWNNPCSSLDSHSSVFLCRFEMGLINLISLKSSGAGEMIRTS